MDVPGIGSAVFATWKLDCKGTQKNGSQKQIGGFILAHNFIWYVCPGPLTL